MTTTIAVTTMTSYRDHRANLVLGVGASFLLMFTACAGSSTAGADVALLLRVKDEKHIELVVTNETDAMLKLPADMVNGPRGTGRSVFLVVRDKSGHQVKRCAIVEVEPERMRDVAVKPSQTAVMTVALSTLMATYCEPKLRLYAAFGSLSRDDQVIANSRSNVLDITIE